ncbi:MAG: lipopolysaccharide biosynthesis protein, partial [Bacteroidota bacterium]
AYTLAIAGVLILQEFMRLNIAMGMIRFGARFLGEGTPEKIGGLFRYALLLTCISITASVLLIAAYVHITPTQNILNHGISTLIILFAFANGLSFIDALSRAGLKLFYRFRSASMLQITMDLTELAVVTWTLYAYGADLNAFIVSVITARIANSIVCNTGALIEFRRELGTALGGSIRLMKPHRAEFNKYILGNSASSSIKVFMNQADVILLGSFFGTSTVGLYAATKKLGYSILSITDPLMQAIFPQFSRILGETSAEKIKPMLKNLVRAAVPAALIILGLCTVFREPIVQFVFGKDYAGAGWPFVISLAGALQGAVFFWALPLVQSLGLIKKRLLVTILGLTSGAIAGYLLTPVFGATGTALALLIANVVITAKFIQMGLQKISTEQINQQIDKKPAR